MKPIKGFPGYFIDKQSNIFSTRRAPQFKRRDNYIYKHPNIYPLKKDLFRGNRHKICLSRLGKPQIRKFVAVVMLETFVCPRPKGMFACHGRKGSLIDSLNNLYWGTPKRNTQDRKRDGTYLFGETCPNVKLTEKQVLEAKKIRTTDNLAYYKIAKMFNVDITTIHRAIIGKTWKHLPILPH